MLALLAVQASPWLTLWGAVALLAGRHGAAGAVIGCSLKDKASVVR